MMVETWPRWKWMGILLTASLFVLGVFIGFSSYSGFLGFPLDDAWIHQVYARNLVQQGEWSYNLGQPSGGSTSPLWSLLLGGAYILGINPVIWSAILGWLALFCTAVLAEDLLRGWLPENKRNFPWIGLFFIMEWHLVWASVSGMETTLFICIVFAVFRVLCKDKNRNWIAGVLIGICTWVRPDGITLLGPAIFLLLFEPGASSRRVRNIAELIIAFLALFVPYLLFNLILAGNIWPSTFSAKQAEYQASTGLPLFQRLWSLFLPFLAGGGVILVPGLLAAIGYATKQRKNEIIAAILWFAGYLVMYAIRLPVNYQHGRYMMPAMACFFLIGLWGMVQWISHWPHQKWFNLTRVFWTVSLAVVTLMFLGMGCVTYKTDVAIIETEMVQTARWIQMNTPPDSRVAAHDIGAMGYFSERKIIDLAGLVNPEVIPFIRDEAKLKDYINTKEIDYLVTFPNWYPQLTHLRPTVYQSGGIYSPQSGGENMRVYIWGSK